METNVVRLIDLGIVPFLRSQTVYHGVAKAMAESSPDTILLSTPREPYACVGFHHDLRREIDLDYCVARGLPVLRREIGGGTVYLDGNQLFYHTVFHRRRAPRRVDDIYRFYLRGPVETYRQMGIEARIEPPNDILVADRKIGGTGAGSIGDAVVVSGSIIFDFDHQSMARLLRSPSVAFQDQIERALERYMTNLRREIGREIPREHVRDLLVTQFAQALGVEIQPGELTAEELAQIDELDRLFLQDEWLHSIERPSPARRVKIRSGVMVCEAETCYSGAHVRVTVTVVNDTIADAAIDGNFAGKNGRSASLESALLGARFESTEVSAALERSAGELGDEAVSAIGKCLSKIARTLAEG